MLADACGPYRVLVFVLAYCGLRWGEVAALRVRNIDLVHRRIRVVEAVTEINGRLVVGSPKTPSGTDRAVAGIRRRHAY